MITLIGRDTTTTPEDSRDRSFGNVSLSYDVNDNFNVLGRLCFDNVNEVREQRANVAVGTGGVANLFDDQPGYQGKIGSDPNTTTTLFSAIYRFN